MTLVLLGFGMPTLSVLRAGSSGGCSGRAMLSGGGGGEPVEKEAGTLLGKEKWK